MCRKTMKIDKWRRRSGPLQVLLIIYAIHVHKSKRRLQYRVVLWVCVWLWLSCRASELSPLQFCSPDKNTIYNMIFSIRHWTLPTLFRLNRISTDQIDKSANPILWVKNTNNSIVLNEYWNYWLDCQRILNLFFSHQRIVDTVMTHNN